MLEHLQAAYDSEAFRKTGHALIDLLADHLKAMTSNAPGKVVDQKDPDELASYWANYQMGENGEIQFFKDVLQQSMHLHHPNYMGHQISPPAPLAALTSLFDATLNNGMGIYEMGQAGTAIEKVVTDTFCQAIGFDEQADGLLTSGGTLANLTALLCARQQTAAGDVWKNGQDSDRVVLVSEEAHYCVDRAVRIMGMGEQGIVKVPVDEQYRMRTDLLPVYLEQVKAKGQQVIAVVGSAPSTSTGAHDDLEAIAAFCQAEDLWFHVDGAHGGAAVFSKKYKPILAGIEKANSVVIDCHKMLMTPSVATALLFRNGDDSYATFNQRAQYLWGKAQGNEWHNLARRTFECTKLMMSLRFYSLMKSQGLEVFDAFVTTLYDLGKQFAQQLEQRSHFALAISPQSNIVCFRYEPKGLSEEATNALNKKIREKIVADGNFYFVSTILNDRLYLRVSLMNPFSSAADFEQLFDLIEEQASHLKHL